MKDLCRRHGFSEASYYLWRSKFGGRTVSAAKWLKALEAQNAPLKSLNFITLKIKDAICDRFREETRERPSIDTEAPDVPVYAFFSPDAPPSSGARRAADPRARR